ncbi:MAG: S8 family serine peptidase, partial [Acidobacteria bacterium]|nr:S8 family serine peptidase [Acidobacteriota bacterium]
MSDAGASNRKVCIIDSGYYLGHEDLPTAPNVTGDNDSGTGNWYQDGSGHGTHVAGTIAGLGGNGKGVVGVLPGNTINLHIVRVFGDDGAWAYSSDLAAAVGKCRNAGANVISMSLGGSFSSGTEQTAFNNAYNAGVLSIAAAGNAGNTSTSYPAGYGSVVSVAAVDSSETVASFSQKNSDVEIAGPGVAVLSTVPYKETNTLTVGATTYSGNHIEFAARSESGVSGDKADGGLCDATNSAWSGKVVLCRRGTVSFFDKVRNVQNSGGVACV